MAFEPANAASRNWPGCKTPEQMQSRASAGKSIDRCKTPAAWQATGRSDFHLTLPTLGKVAGLGSHQLERAFRSVMGISPRQYADARRMQWLKSKLKKGDDVTTALYDAGFGSSSRLYERAPRAPGHDARNLPKAEQAWKFATPIANSPLGRLLVGATESGISAIYLGKEEAPLEAELRQEYPRAEIHRDRNGMQRLGRKNPRYLRGHQPELDLSMDVLATAFSAASGRSCAVFPTARRALIASSPAPLDSPPRFAPWPAPAPPIQFPW